MGTQVEFGAFYKLIQSVKDGDEKKNKELEWMLAEYEHAKESTGPYDELGQIFCHHGIMGLYEYTGIDNIRTISTLDKSVWEYLELRTGINLNQYIVRYITDHAKEHSLAKKISTKWETAIDELEINLDDLASYVVQGITDLVSY